MLQIGLFLLLQAIIFSNQIESSWTIISSWKRQNLKKKNMNLNTKGIHRSHTRNPYKKELPSWLGEGLNRHWLNDKGKGH